MYCDEESKLIRHELNEADLDRLLSGLPLSPAVVCTVADMKSCALFIAGSQANEQTDGHAGAHVQTIRWRGIRQRRPAVTFIASTHGDDHAAHLMTVCVYSGSM